MCRVLVVDDNADAADSLAALLELLGHETRLARDGEQAIETARVFAPDVILMDIGLPRMDGIETARRIRQLSTTTLPRIVALSGWAHEADPRSRAAGIDLHLVKPVELERLKQVLEERC